MTKTQRACLIDSAIFPLTITARHDDMPTKARAAAGRNYGRHTLFTAINNNWLEPDTHDGLLLSQEGMMALSPQVACVLTAMRCLETSLKHMR